MRLAELLGVEPADDTAARARTARARPQRVVGVVREIKVMGREAGVDHVPLAGRGIEAREFARGGRLRIGLGGRMVRALLAVIGVGRRPQLGGEPDLALLIHHHVVNGGVAVPDRLVAPIGRSAVRRIRRTLHLLVEVGLLDRGGDVLDRVERRNEIGALFRRAVDQPVGVDMRVALVGRDRVMLVMRRRRPVPQRVDDVALDALRAFRLVERQRAAGDLVGPLREHVIDLVRSDAVDRGRHVFHGLARLRAHRPGGLRVLALVHEHLRHFANALRAERMARLAHVLHGIDELRLALHRLRHLVALGAGAGEFAGRGNVDQRIPVHAGIMLRVGGGGGRRLDLEVDGLARARFDLLAVGQAIAANPDLVVCIRQFRNDEAALIVGDDDLGIFGRQILGLGDDPDAGLRALVADHLPADVVGGDIDLGRQRGAAEHQRQCACARGDQPIQLHGSFPHRARLRLFMAARSRPLWHTVRHVSYFDQSLLVVECSASAMACFSHGEKARPPDEVWRPLIADIDGSREELYAPHSATAHSSKQMCRWREAMRIFVRDPLGIGGLSFNMRSKFQVQEDQQQYVSKTTGAGGHQEPRPAETKGRTAWLGATTASRAAATRRMSDASGRL